jgi:hypothetical protein
MRDEIPRQIQETPSVAISLHETFDIQIILETATVLTHICDGKNVGSFLRFNKDSTHVSSDALFSHVQNVVSTSHLKSMILVETYFKVSL